jgi:hypothetical protein
MTLSLDQAFDHINRQSRTDGYVSSMAGAGKIAMVTKETTGMLAPEIPTR